MSIQQLNVELLGNATAPGVTIRELLEERKMSQKELADRIDLDKKTINQIVAGQAPVTQDTALALEKVFGPGASFWLTLEANYQASLAAQKQHQNLESYAEWISGFPYAEMARRGWIDHANTVAEKTGNLLRYFQVANPTGWRRIYLEKSLGASYRKRQSASENASVASVWLRQGEVAADEVSVSEPFDAGKFRTSLAAIRRLTLLKDLRDIESAIQKHCKMAGVIYVLVREMPGLGINGAMRWIGDRPMIQQSLHGKSHDAFWFTFFHEAWHVLQKQKKKVFLEGDDANEEDIVREAEADAMAAEFLIPKEAYFSYLAETQTKSIASIQLFADSIGIHPGIIVGRLQKENRIPWSSPLNRLKAQLHWPS